MEFWPENLYQWSQVILAGFLILGVLVQGVLIAVMLYQCRLLKNTNRIYSRIQASEEHQVEELKKQTRMQEEQNRRAAMAPYLDLMEHVRCLFDQLKTRDRFTSADVDNWRSGLGKLKRPDSVWWDQFCKEVVAKANRHSELTDKINKANKESQQNTEACQDHMSELKLLCEFFSDRSKFGEFKINVGLSDDQIEQHRKADERRMLTQPTTDYPEIPD